MNNSTNIDECQDMDGLIKFLLAVSLAVMPFMFQKELSFGILCIYLLTVTLVSKIKFNTLLISAASYGIIVVIPYLFGFFMNELFYTLTSNELFTTNQGTYAIFLRLFRLFIIWYVSILYFHTTPMKTVLGLLDKLFFPLTLIGVPVKDYLKVVMCIVIELKGTGEEMKHRFLENARSVLGGSKGRFKIKGLSQIIVSLLVSSFEKLDKIQSFVEKTDPDDLYHYTFKISKRDVAAGVSFVLLSSILFIIEKGYL